MAQLRSQIPDFQLANPRYVGATVTFYTVDGDGDKTATLATLYSGPLGSGTVANPQTLDGDGKFSSPVYIDEPVIGEVVGSSVGSHDTGIIAPRGTWKGDWVTLTRYISGDLIRDPATDSLYAATNDYVSGASVAADVLAGDLELVLDADAIAVLATRAAGFPYLFSTTTAMADPGAGALRLNHATLASVTAIAIDDTTAASGNPDISAFINSWDDGDSLIKGYLQIWSGPTGNAFALFQVNSLTDNSGWSQIAVTHIASSGTFANADDISITFNRTGDKGERGEQPGLVYDFSTTTSMADPGVGQVRLNNATLASVTAIAVDDQTADTGNPNVAAFVTTWSDSLASIKGRLTIKKIDAPENFAIYNVTGLTDNSGWTQLAVAYVTAAGSFGNGDDVVLEFVPTVSPTINWPTETETGTVTLDASDGTKLKRFTNTATANLTAAATLGDGWFCMVKATNGDVTLDPNGAETIDGAATLVIKSGQSALVFCDGTGFQTLYGSPASYATQTLSEAQREQARANMGLTIVGAVTDFAGTSAPTGWLFCYGQAVSRTTYAALFAVLGTTYGSGDGSTTFNIPDLRGRVVAGQDDMGGSSANRLTGLSGGVDGDVLGGSGGAESHTITTAQLPSTVPNGAGTVSNYVVGAGAAANVPQASGGGWTGGGGGAHNNVQPTFILNKIIFAGV
jgi:microcystin-dependent protein